MNLLYVVLVSAVVLSIAYRLYGGLLARLLRLNADEPTPAVKFRDDVDYAPIEAKFLLGQHFSAIAAAGPIVGPILAGMFFGWLPALLWILFGSIFIGGVHDMLALVASVRHRATSIAEVVRDNMSRRSYLLFLSFIWIALVYIVVAFTDVTASAFIGTQTLENGDKIAGAEIAGSSLIYLVLPLLMGLLLRYTKLSLNWATIIFLPLVGLSIYAGQFVPIDLQGFLGLSEAGAHKTWDVLLLVYCLVAAVVPMWLLLQPRGHLGGYFLYAALGAGGLGLLLSSFQGGQPIEYPAFIGWTGTNGSTLFPFLFITIACGACSGFHSLIASGTTSKQLRTETDAKPIGYGSMLLEAMVAILSLACVMILAKDASVLAKPKPNYIYAQGMGNFLQALHIPAKFAVTFALMAFTTFVYDTLDVCTRLGRYILQELTGWRTGAGKWLATAATAGVPLIFVLSQPIGPDGKPVELWRVFWELFGASNQLLAALTLLGVTVWLWRTRRAWWVWLVTGLPTVLMYVMSVWALVKIVTASLSSPRVLEKEGLLARSLEAGPVPFVAVILVALALLMLVEAVLVFAGRSSPPPMSPQAAQAAA
ncbi:MAG: carbon starvation protein A [Pirellulales bacterium]